MQMEFQPLGVRLRLDHRDHVFQKPRKLVLALDDLQLARLDLREVEDVVDDG